MPFLRALFIPTVIVVTTGIYMLKPTQVHTPTVNETVATTTIVGFSEQQREISLYSFGSGQKRILFVGGIHGGYEWNTVVLAHELINEVASQTKRIPEGITIDIIPNLNPDGLVRTFGTTSIDNLKPTTVTEDIKRSGRFNANNVDLNRNFDCLWEPKSKWGNTTVNAGPSPFSESEAKALKQYVETYKPEAVVFYHSKANAVFGAACNGVTPQNTDKLLALYSTASNYTSIPLFDAYTVTGDAESWLAKIGIPAITVELSSHETTDSIKNTAGLWALVEGW